MITEIAGVLGSLNAARQIGTGLIGIHDQHVVQEKVMELNSKIIDAQGAIYALAQERSDLADKIRELEAELKRQSDWENTRSRYKLATIGNTQIFVYMLTAKDEQAHYACPTCFEKRKRSVLQLETRVGRAQVYACHECKTDLYYSGIRMSDEQRARPRL